MTVMVTGSAGFIGYHVCSKLLARGDRVVGIDNVNDYYDPSLKRARLARLTPQPAFQFCQADLVERDVISRVFEEVRPEAVINLAAQAGVRYSITHPHAYIDSNLVGFLNILEGCRHSEVKHLVYASSSSVYGSNGAMPFSIHQNVDHPLSLYAASKKANELMAHTYSHLFRVPTTGLRFFTVYGPWGRPDMAIFLFTRAILEGRPIDVFNFGRMKRDFTFIDDIAEGVIRVLDHPPAPNPNFSPKTPDPASSSSPYRIYNIGASEPVELLYLIELLEKALGRRAEKNLLPMQPGDVPETFADVEDLAREIGFRPRVPIETGIQRFVEWYRSYYTEDQVPGLRS